MMMMMMIIISIIIIIIMKIMKITQMEKIRIFMLQKIKTTKNNNKADLLFCEKVMRWLIDSNNTINNYIDNEMSTTKKVTKEAIRGLTRSNKR